MRVALLGTGLQARAISYDLTRQEDLTEIVLADADLDAARSLAERWEDPRLRPVRLDAADFASVRSVLEGCDAALSAVPYRFNAGLAEAAIQARCSFCDLGGNNPVVNQELALHERALAAGVTIVPDCGVAPGMVAVLAADAVAELDTVRSLEMRVGGLPQERDGFLNYSLLFNMEGLINEYVEDAVVLENGQPKVVRSLDAFETLEFPEPFGTMEAFTTSGGTSTLPETYRGKIDTLNYKTVRYPGHGRVFQAIMDLGLLSRDPVDVDGVSVAPRAVFSKVAGPVLDKGLVDVTLFRVTAQGTRDGKPVTRIYQMIDYPDTENDLTSMMRVTAYPSSIVLLMLARGQIAEKGALPQERCVDPKRFLEEVEARDLPLTIQET